MDDTIAFVGEIVRLFPIGEKFIQPLSRRGYRWKEWSDFRKIGIGRISQREREREEKSEIVCLWLAHRFEISL